jgi:RHS repeat-associated protein
MKTKLAFTLLAMTAISLNLHAATSALPAPLPNFMDQAQLAKWNADQVAATKSTTFASEPSTQFYTGKPYVADAGGYIYKYRTYNPEISRWTSADPSGFSDGPNDEFYAPIPTEYIDPTGLASIKDSTNTYTITNTTATPIGNSFSYAFNGYSFTGGTLQTGTSLSVTSQEPIDYGTSQYWGGYSLGTDGVNPAGGAGLTVSVNNPVTTAGSTYAWIQIITTNDPGANHPASPASYYDIMSDQNTPFYPGGGTSSSYFTDYSWRIYADLGLTTPKPINWTASLYYVSYTASKAVTVYGGFTWDYQIE